MLGENGYPLTPDWIPESRCCDGCPESAVPHSVRLTLRSTLDEAMAAWDGDWTTWSGDDG